jgi:hypothetical protein
MKEECCCGRNKEANCCGRTREDRRDTGRKNLVALEQKRSAVVEVKQSDVAVEENKSAVAAEQSESSVNPSLFLQLSSSLYDFPCISLSCQWCTRHLLLLSRFLMNNDSTVGTFGFRITLLSDSASTKQSVRPDAAILMERNEILRRLKLAQRRPKRRIRICSWAQKSQKIN